MALERLFIRKQKTIGGIVLDAVLTEAHANNIAITRNPVEAGAEITDHAVVLPKRLVMLVEVTDSPLGLAAVGAIVDTVTGLFGTSTTENVTRSSAAYNAMVQLTEQRDPLTVQTGLRLYESMLITNVATTQDKNSSRVATMSITFDEIIVAESELVVIEEEQVTGSATKKQATSPVQKGKVEPATPTESTNTSVLKTVADWIG